VLEEDPPAIRAPNRWPRCPRPPVAVCDAESWNRGVRAVRIRGWCPAERRGWRRPRV